MKHRSPELYLLIGPVIILLALLTAFPTVYLLYLSFCRYYLARDASPVFHGLRGYATVLSSKRFLQSLQVTVTFSSITVMGTVLSGLLLALFLNRTFKARSVFRVLITLPMIITPIALALMWKLIYDPSFGILNYLLGVARLPQPNWLGSGSMAMKSVIIVDIWQWTPFVTLIVLAGLQGIPKYLYEAASVDSASPTQMFYCITLPLIRPTLLVAVLFKFIYSLKSFDIIYGLTFGGPGSATEILNIYIYRTSFYFMRMGRGSTIAVMLLFATIGVCSAIVRLLTTRQG